MFGRPHRHCVLLTIVLALVACGGDDADASSESSSTSGSAGARASSTSASGTAGTGGTGGAGRSGRAAAGRGAFGGQMCPMTEAEATGSCTPARGTCTFDTRVCDCIRDTMTWACWSPADCPTDTPAEQSSCSVVGMTCSPMPRMTCTCTAQGWDCGNQFCPPDEPAPGGMCEGGDGVCTYGARTCDCNNNAWTCWSPATDCSAKPPADRAACPIDGVICEYEGGSCECNGMRGWRCGNGVMNDPDPDDAGVSMGTDASVAGASGGAGSGGTAGQAGSAGVSGSSGSSAGSAGTP